MAEKTGSITAEDRLQTENVPTAMNKSDMPWHEREKDTERMRSEVRDLEEDLVASIAVLRHRLSLSTMKARAKDELRELAVTKPKAALSTAGHTGGELLRRLFEASKEQPIIPIAISAAFVGMAALRRILGGDKR